MRPAYRLPLSVLLLAGSPLAGRGAQAPQNVSVAFNGETDAIDPLAAGEWHTLTANYRYPGRIGLLTNTFVVIARGGDLLRGLDVGYNLPTNQLMIVKHGFRNATEATGQPGEKGKIIENDQAYLDCENTIIKRTADEISVSYRIKFKPQVLKGLYSVSLYIEDKDVNHDGFTIISSVTIDRDAAVHRTDMPAQWVNSLKPQGAAAATLTLADKGQARYALVIPTDAKRIEKKAASDLRLCLKLISQADFAMVSEADLPASNGPYISVGRTQRLANSPCQWKDADLAAEGYASEVVGENLYLYGGTGRGLLHGVYSLLEEDLGCRWYSTTSVDTPRTERLAVRLTPRKYLPVLELRDPYKGVSERWHVDPQNYESARQLAGGSECTPTPAGTLKAGLHRLHINRGVGWEQQGFPGFDGYGWYFQDIEIPDGLLNKQHLYLDFLSVNEQAWVYVNGELACERSYASTGKGVGDLVGAAFSFDAKKWLKPGGRNRIAVRVTHSTGLGGILQPAMLVATDEECSTGQLDRFRY